MSRIDKQIALSRSSLTENSTCPPEIIELILKFVQWLYEGPYTRNDFWDLPFGSAHNFILKMHIDGNLPYAYYHGKVEVIRVKLSGQYMFIFKFMGHVFVRCKFESAKRLYECLKASIVVNSMLMTGIQVTNKKRTILNFAILP